MTTEEILLSSENFGGLADDSCITFPILGTDRDDENIEKFYRDAMYSLIHDTNNDILFGGKEYNIGMFDYEYYEKTYKDENGITLIDEKSFVSRKEIIKRLNCFMRGYKLRKIMNTIQDMDSKNTIQSTDSKSKI